MLAYCHGTDKLTRLISRSIANLLRHGTYHGTDKPTHLISRSTANLYITAPTNLHPETEPEWKEAPDRVCHTGGLIDRRSTIDRPINGPTR
jgi:hypothetical protein